VAGGAVAGGLVGVGAGAIAGSAFVRFAGVEAAGGLGSTIVSSWQKAEETVRRLISGVTARFYTPYGYRVVDAYYKTDNLIAECKYGKVNLTSFVRNQVMKDYFLLQKGRVTSVQWHFFVSQATGQGGPSKPLLELLKKLGITIIYH
jgi:hypothetical protein